MSVIPSSSSEVESRWTASLVKATLVVELLAVVCAVLLPVIVRVVNRTLH